MEEYIVSARKYRPLTFDTVVGQPSLTTTLKHAVLSGKLAHAYLFCGPRGVGKTTCARIFAKTINCLHPTAEGEACNECESCIAFNEQRSYNIFELDAASNNSVENIKALMDQTRIPPQVGKYKVFIIDEVHMLSTQAFNAFLKTLEEPPAHVIFILATTEKHKILPTILSRCQIYDFERITVSGIINHLKDVAGKEGVTYEEEALNVIAEKADGGMRDALSIFDQAVSFSEGNITYAKVIEDLNVLDTDNYFNIIDYALDNKVTDIMVLLNTVISKGFDEGNLIRGLASHVRNVLMAKDPQTLPLLEVSKNQSEKFKEQATKCPTPFLYKALEIINRCDINYRQSSNKRLLVELTLIQVAQITQPDDDADASGRSPKRLKSLFQNLKTSQSITAEQVAGVETNTISFAQTDTPVMAKEPEENVKQTVMSNPKAQSNGVGFTFASLKKSNTQASTNDIATQSVPDSEAKEFNQDTLAMEWLAMCNRMPKEMNGISSRMKNIIPQIKDYPNIEIVVDNNILLSQIKDIKTNIHSTLVGALHNGNIKLNIRLAEAEEIKPILSKREVFERMKQSNKAIYKLANNLNLELTQS